MRKRHMQFGSLEWEHFLELVKLFPIYSTLPASFSKRTSPHDLRFAVRLLQGSHVATKTRVHGGRLDVTHLQKLESVLLVSCSRLGRSSVWSAVAD